jgi:hypothetical protein
VIQRSILAAALLWAAPALGQGIDSPYDFVEGSQEFWLFGGPILADRGVIDTGPGSGYAAGLGYTIRFSGPFNFDARVAYLPTDRRVYNITPADSAAVAEDPMVGLVELGTADLSLLLIDAALRFDITGPRTWHRLQPFALIGVGGIIGVSSDNSAEENLPTDIDLRTRFKNGVTGHVGIGAEAHLNDRFSLRLEARDLLWRIHVPAGFRVPGRLIDDAKWVQTGHFYVGLAYRF